ncbi:MAG: autotransporter outer membrane beta-barrel domain-containing protein [Acidithiobacillus sp.]
MPSLLWLSALHPHHGVGKKVSALPYAVRQTLIHSLCFPLLLAPVTTLAGPQVISEGGTVTESPGNTNPAGIVVNASTLDITAGSALGTGLLDLQNGALRTSAGVSDAGNIQLDPGTAPTTLSSPCGGAYCFGVGDSMTLNTVGNTYASVPSLLQQMQFPSNNKALGIWLTQGWQPGWMAGMQTAMQQGYAPVLFDYYLGDLGSMGSGAWGYVQQNAQAWLANTRQLANYLSTLNGTVSVVIQPEFNVPGVGSNPQFGSLLAQVSQILHSAGHPGLTILTSAGVGDFGVYSGSTENASQWGTFYPSLSVAAPYLNFITFQEMRGAATGGSVVSAQQEGMNTIAGRVIAFSRYLQAAYGKPLLLGYMMMNPYTPAGDTENWSAIAAKAYAEILQISPELRQQGVFGSMAMALFNDATHATSNGVDYFGTSSDYFGLVNSNGAPNTSAVGNGPYVLNADGQAWVNGTASAGTVQNVSNGGTLDTRGNADTFSGTLSGQGGLFVVGGGSVTLTGNNTYAGNTYIADSTLLQLGNGGSSGSILGNVLSDGVLSFNRADNILFPGQISGFGLVWQQGPGTLQLTGSNSYAGGTLITGGALSVGAESALGSGNITLDGGTLKTTAGLNDGRTIFIGPNGGTLNTGGNTDLFSGNFMPMSSIPDGGLAVTGGGTAVLTGNNTYTGGTTIAGYTALQIGDGGRGGSLPGNVVDNGALAFNRASTITVPGQISGYGMLWQQGPGALMLMGSNTYAGGTTIAGGTLGIDSASALGTGGLTLNGGTLLTAAPLSMALPITIGAGGGAVDTDGNSDIFTGNLGSGSGAGPLSVVGGGTLILNGPSNMAAGTTVGGPSGFSSATTPTTLEVGDPAHPNAALQGPVQVTPAGVLRGHGTIVGNVTNDGTVFPGGSIGTLNIRGNYIQNAGGTLAIEVTPTAHDVLNVSGTAAIAGRLLVQVDPGASYVAGDQYQILVAGGGITGAFSTTVYDPFPAYVTPTLTNNAGGLSINLSATPVPAGMNAAPAYLGGQIYADIPTALINMTAQADALVLGHGKGSAGAAIARTMLASTGTTTAGQLANFSAPPSRNHAEDGLVSPQSGAWIQGLGDFGHARGSDSVSSFADQSSGVYAGIDLRQGGFTAGVALGYVHTLLNLPTTGYAGGSQANIDSATTMIYGKYQKQGLFLQGLVGYTSESIQGLRNLPDTGVAAMSDHHGSMIHAVFQAGYAIKTPWVTVTPNFGIASYHQSQPGFSEYGATTLLDLHYAHQTVNETDADVGVKVSHRYRLHALTLTPYLDAAVQRNLSSNARSITETLGSLSPVTESGVAPDRTALVTSLGASLNITHRLSFYTEYREVFASNITNTGIAAGGVWRW